MILNLLEELSCGLGDDSLLRLLLHPCELLQQLGSYHGVSLPTSCLPVRHDAHIITARQKKNLLDFIHSQQHFPYGQWLRGGV